MAEQVARHDEQIQSLNRRLDLWARIMFAVFVALLGAGASFLFVIIGQLGS